MTSQEKLVRFMREKANLIANAINKPPELYFNEKDEEYLRQLDDKLASAVWHSIKTAIYLGEEALHEGTCPFCLAVEHKCHICPYAKQHGICPHPDSHFRRILEGDLEWLYGAAENVLTNEFYKELVRRIEAIEGDDASLNNLT